MKLIRIILVVLTFIILLVLNGCGDGSGSTNGSLRMSELVVTIQPGGTFLVTGTATYTPPAGKVPNGVSMNISANLVTQTFTRTVSLDSTGIAQISFSASQPSTVGVVMVDASIDGLSAHKEASVAAFP